MEGSPPWTEIFMPLTGESLKTLATATTKTAELSELAQTVLHQMFQALDHVASDSIIHRDIKPDNILYEPRCKEWGRPYHFFLADFGLSQEMVKATTITGTEPFMAPEVVHRHRGFIQHLEQGPRGRISQFRVHGKVLGTSVVALPDSGADVCFISQSLARKLLLYPTPGTGRRIRVANNTYLRSSGSVEVSWQFPGELGTYPIVCWVLPTCGLNVDMILGRKFLKATNTSMRGPRVQKTYAWVPRSVSVKLLGEGKQRLWGYLNGDLVPALPDTGSDIMAMSKAYATKLGLRIDSNSKDIVEVEFPNGTTALTDGVVRNVPWTIGDHTSRWDFFVLDDLCVDVILSKDYVFDYDVFAEYENLLTDDETTDHLLDLYGVRLLRTFGPALEQLAEESIEDMTSPDAFSPGMVNREWARQDRILDQIESLPIDQRDRAREEEAERQRQWKEARAEHERRWAQTATPPPAPLTATGSQGAAATGAQGDGSPNVGPQLPSHRPKKKKFRISIPLLPIMGRARSDQSS